MKKFVAIASFLGLSALAQEVGFRSARIIGTFSKEEMEQFEEDLALAGLKQDPRPVSFSTRKAQGNWDHYEGLDVSTAQYSFGSVRQIGILGEDEDGPVRSADDLITFTSQKINGNLAEEEEEEEVIWTKLESAQKEERKAVLKAVLITFFVTWFVAMALFGIVYYCLVKQFKKVIVGMAAAQ